MEAKSSLKRAFFSSELTAVLSTELLAFPTVFSLEVIGHKSPSWACSLSPWQGDGDLAVRSQGVHAAPLLALPRKRPVLSTKLGEVMGPEL